jgi:hypothetical protein
MKRRRVVLQKSTPDGADPFDGLSEKEVLAKAQLAIELMTAEGEIEAQGIEFLHARRTSNGGAIVVTKTIKGAEWLRGDEVMATFAAKMGGAVIARPDACTVIAEYIPTSFTPGTRAALGQVEQDSGLQKGAIRYA